SPPTRSTLFPYTTLFRSVPSGEQEIWTLTGVLARGDLSGALHYAHTLLRSGEDPFSLWNVLLWMVRSLTSVSLCVWDGERRGRRSEEHTSELQSRGHLVC